MLLRRSVDVGSAVFEHGITDVTEMSFPCVALEPTDKVLCIFRRDWRFGLAFDFNPDGKLDVEAFTTTLGTLYRDMTGDHRQPIGAAVRRRLAMA